MLSKPHDPQEQILAELQALKAAIASPKLHEKELWTIQDISEYLALSRKTLSNQIFNNPTFPLAVELGHDGKRTKRWYSEDIRAWVARHRSESNRAFRRAR